MNDDADCKTSPLLPPLPITLPRTYAHAHAYTSSVPRVAFKRGGPTQAKALLARFLRDRLKGYATHRKEASLRHQSFLSPYLHFGHISSLYVALKVGRKGRWLSCPVGFRTAWFGGENGLTG